MNKVRNQTAHRILDLALEIIYLLTGEDHMVVKIPELVHDNNSRQISEGCDKAQHHSTEPPLHSLIHMVNNEQKILELANKIIQLLSGEVPIRCEDVTVYLSMEEWQYLEGHKELYKDVMMEDHQPIVLLDNFSPGEFHTPVSLPGFGIKNGTENETDNGEKYPKITKTIEGPAKSETNAKREPLAFEDRSVLETEINVTTEHSQTEYPPIDIKEEPDSCEENLTESDIYKLTLHTQAESDMCGVRYITDPDLYLPTKHTQTKYIHGNLDEYLTGNTSPLEEMPSTSFIESSKQKKLFKCRECGKCFPKNYKLIIHLRVHTGERPFKCTECGKCFTRASYLAAHKMIHTGEKPFRCTDCGKCFTRALSLATHKLIHTGEKTFNCTECDKCFTRASSLVRHKIIHTGEKPFKCSECERCFTWGSDLTRHKMIHTGEKPFNCTECGKCFTQASDLATHKIIHTGEKPYKCTECEKCFSWASDLTRHKMIHTGEKPHNCTECGKSFSQGSDLVRHKMIHNGEKPFKCNVCGKGFPRNDHAILHQRLHIRDKPFNFP